MRSGLLEREQDEVEDEPLQKGSLGSGPTVTPDQNIGSYIRDSGICTRPVINLDLPFRDVGFAHRSEGKQCEHGVGQGTMTETQLWLKERGASPRSPH